MIGVSFAASQHTWIGLLSAAVVLFSPPSIAQEIGTQQPPLEAAEIEALVAKQKHRNDVLEKLRRGDAVKKQPQPHTRSIDDYPLGRFENLPRNRLQWGALSWFQFVPKTNRPFAFVRSTGDRITPRNFFTDGGSIPRIFQWGAELAPFGYLPVYLIHDWEFDLHHCNQTTKSFEDVANTMMEALRTLMDGGHVPRNGFAFWMIETGINSFVARELWDTMPEKCPIPSYKPDP